MLSSSGDIPAGLHVSGTSVLVLRLEPGTPETGRLEIGIGTIASSSQASMQVRSRSGPSLQLTVVFPQSGGNQVYEVGPIDGCSAGSKEAPAAGPLRAFSLDVLAPFEFSGIAYDPPGSIAASVARLAAADTVKPGDVSGRPTGRRGAPVGRPGTPAGRSGWSGRPNDTLMALWAAVETDLYRFAKDPGFTAAVDLAATGQPEEYRRFARLNDLYRDMVKLLVPHGLAPRRWTAWLMGQEYRPVLPVSLALRMEVFLSGGARQPRDTLEALTRLLVRHGALVMQEQD
jgi:hypothetical protein